MSKLVVIWRKIKVWDQTIFQSAAIVRGALISPFLQLLRFLVVFSKDGGKRKAYKIHNGSDNIGNDFCFVSLSHCIFICSQRGVQLHSQKVGLLQEPEGYWLIGILCCRASQVSQDFAKEVRMSKHVLDVNILLHKSPGFINTWFNGQVKM